MARIAPAGTNLTVTPPAATVTDLAANGTVATDPAVPQCVDKLDSDNVAIADVMRWYRENGRAVIDAILALKEKVAGATVQPEHLVVAILSDRGSTSINSGAIMLSGNVQSTEGSQGVVSGRLLHVLDVAKTASLAQSVPCTLDFLGKLMTEHAGWQNQPFVGLLREGMISVRQGEQAARRIGAGVTDSTATVLDAKLDGKKYPELSAVGFNMTSRAQEQRYIGAAGREAEIEFVLDTIAKEGTNSLILHGDASVGKTAILEEMANRGDAIFIRTSAASFEAYLNAQSGNKVLELATQARAAKTEKGKPVVLVIDEIHNLSEKVLEALKEVQDRGDLCILGATTTDKWKETFEKDEARARRYNNGKTIEPLTAGQTRVALMRRANFYSSDDVLQIDPSAIEAILEYAHLNRGALPGAAIDLLDGSAAIVRRRLGAAIPLVIESLEREIAEGEAIVASFSQGSDGKSVDMTSVSIAQETLEERRSDLIKFYDQLANEKELLAQQQDLWTRIKDAEREATTDEDFAGIRTMRAEATRLREQLEKIMPRLLSPVVDRSVVLNHLVSKMNLRPEDLIHGDDKDIYVNFEAHMHEGGVVGQDAVLEALGKMIRRRRAGLSNTKTDFTMISGETGAGKTHILLTMGKLLFGENKVEIFDMTNTMEQHETSRIVGAPPGYIGFEDGSEVLKAIENGKRFIIFNEIDKMHWTGFLRLMEWIDAGKGRHLGREVNLEGVTFAATSNFGGELISQLVASGEYTREKAEELVKRVFNEKIRRPEILPRLERGGAVIVADPNTIEVAAQVLDNKFDALRVQFLEQTGKHLGFTQELHAFVLGEGFQPGLGNRGLDAVMSKYVIDVPSDQLLAGTLEDTSHLMLGYGVDPNAVPNASDTTGKPVVFVRKMTSEERVEYDAKHAPKGEPVPTGRQESP